MTSHELFSRIPPGLVTDMLEFTHSTEKPLYRTLLDSVAQSRKMRTVFLERQPRTSRHALLAASLARPGLEAAATNLLGTWLLKKHAALVIDFLDALKITHDKGMVEDLPDAVEDGALQSAVEGLLVRHPAELACVYLHAFRAINQVRWPGLDKLLDTDARLQLPAPDSPLQKQQPT